MADDTIPGFSLHWQVRDYVRSTIEGLALPGIVSVVHRSFPVLDGVKTPGVVVCPGRVGTNRAAGTNERDDIDYGVLVVTAKASERVIDADSDTLRRQEENHETIRKALYNVRPDAEFVGGCWIGTSVTDGSPFIPDRFRQQWDASYWLFGFLMRCERG